MGHRASIMVLAMGNEVVAMSKPRIADLIAAEKEATPGPWCGEYGEITQHWSCDKPWLDVVSLEGSDSWSGCNHRLQIRDEDIAFIALARNALPVLMEIAQAAQDVIEQLPEHDSYWTGADRKLLDALDKIDWEGWEP